MSEDGAVTTSYAERAPAALERVVRLAGPVYEQLAGGPRDGSAGWVEFAAGESWAHDGWGAAPVVGAHVDAVFQARVADDHFTALAALLRQREAVFAAHSVARAGIETAATAAWLLAGDGAGARVGRWCGARLASWRQYAGTLRKALSGIDDAEERLRVQADLAQVERRMAGLETAARSRDVGLVRPPGAEQRVQALFGHGMARATYATLSGVAHGEPWALAQLLEPVGPSTGDLVVVAAETVLSDVRLGLLTTSALVAHHRVLFRAAQLWGVAVPADWLEAIDAAMADAASAVS